MKYMQYNGSTMYCSAMVQISYNCLALSVTVGTNMG